MNSKQTLKGPAEHTEHHSPKNGTPDRTEEKGILHLPEQSHYRSGGHIRPADILLMQKIAGNRATVQRFSEEEEFGKGSEEAVGYDDDPGYTGYVVDGEHGYNKLSGGEQLGSGSDEAVGYDDDPGYTGYEVEGEHGYDKLGGGQQLGKDGGKGKAGFVNTGGMPEDYPDDVFEPPEELKPKEGGIVVPATGGGHLSGLDPSEEDW